jgi:hypothetical protein
MDDRAVSGARAAGVPDPSVLSVDGVEVDAFSAVVERLRADYPGQSATRIEGILLREWDAFAAGRPLVVPIAVEAGVREILDGS